jgi:hypothetical protein
MTTLCLLCFSTPIWESGSLEHTVFSWLLRLCFLSLLLIACSTVLSAIGIISKGHDGLTTSGSGSTTQNWWRKFAVVNLFLTWRQKRETRRIEALREYRSHLEKFIPPRGMARFWSTIFSVVIAMWAATGIWAVQDHKRVQQQEQQIQELQAEIAHYRAGEVTEYNLTVLGRDSDGDYDFISDQEPHGGSFRPCRADIQNGVNVYAILDAAIHYGRKIPRVVWEERGDCKSILRDGLGFWFKDKSNFHLTGGD